MKNKKIIIIIIAIVLLAVIASVTVIFVIPYFNYEEKPEIIDYCSNEVELNKTGTNYEHNNVNYIVDREDNRVNTSEKLLEKHENFQFRNSKPGLTMENTKFVSYKCDEARAFIITTMTNNTGEDIKGALLYLKTVDENGEEVNFLFEDMPNILNGETKQIEVPTYTRIIDAHDFIFTYYMSNGEVDEQP